MQQLLRPDGNAAGHRDFRRHIKGCRDLWTGHPARCVVLRLQPAAAVKAIEQVWHPLYEWKAWESKSSHEVGVVKGASL